MIALLRGREHHRSFPQREGRHRRAPPSSRRVCRAKRMFLDTLLGWRAQRKSSPSAQTRPTRSRTRPLTSATPRQTSRTSVTRDSTTMGWIFGRGKLSSRCRRESREDEMRSWKYRAGRRMPDMRQTQDAMRRNAVIHGSECLVYCTL